MQTEKLSKRVFALWQNKKVIRYGAASLTYWGWTQFFLLWLPNLFLTIMPLKRENFLGFLTKKDF